MKNVDYRLTEDQKAAIETKAKAGCEVRQLGIPGSIEIVIPTPVMWGEISGAVIDNSGAPSNIIRADKEWGVELEWGVYGTLVQFMCGAWCVRLHCESMGPGEEFDIPQAGRGKCERTIPMDPCKSCYGTKIMVPGGFVKPEWCGTPYKIVATVQYLTACDDIPGPITGFVEFPLIEFYEAKTEEKKK